MTHNVVESVVSNVIDAQYQSIEAGDMDRFRTCFTPDAVVWHAYDEVEQDIESVAQALGLLGAVSSQVKYEDRRITAVGADVFLQHTLTAQLLDGGSLRLPAMMHVMLGANGRISRIEEYFDSRAMDVLQEPFLRAMGK